MQYHGRSLRKSSGGKYRPHRKKKKALKGRDYIPTLLSEREERKIIRTRGGNQKVLIKKALFVKVADKNGITKKAKILNVLENKSNRKFARSNIITKGAIVETEIGKVKITSRPNQVGILNGVLIEEKK